MGYGFFWAPPYMYWYTPERLGRISEQFGQTDLGERTVFPKLGGTFLKDVVPDVSVQW